MNEWMNDEWPLRSNWWLNLPCRANWAKIYQLHLHLTPNPTSSLFVSFFVRFYFSITVVSYLHWKSVCIHTCEIFILYCVERLSVFKFSSQPNSKRNHLSYSRVGNKAPVGGLYKKKGLLACVHHSFMQSSGLIRFDFMLVGFLLSHFLFDPFWLKIWNNPWHMIHCFGSNCSKLGV